MPVDKVSLGVNAGSGDGPLLFHIDVGRSGGGGETSLDCGIASARSSEVGPIGGSGWAIDAYANDAEREDAGREGGAVLRGERDQDGPRAGRHRPPLAFAPSGDHDEFQDFALHQKTDCADDEVGANLIIASTCARDDGGERDAVYDAVRLADVVTLCDVVNVIGLTRRHWEMHTRAPLAAPLGGGLWPGNLHRALAARRTGWWSPTWRGVGLSPDRSPWNHVTACGVQMHCAGDATPGGGCPWRNRRCRVHVWDYGDDQDASRCGSGGCCCPQLLLHFTCDAPFAKGGCRCGNGLSVARWRPDAWEDVDGDEVNLEDAIDREWLMGTMRDQYGYTVNATLFLSWDDWLMEDMRFWTMIGPYSRPSDMRGGHIDLGFNFLVYFLIGLAPRGPRVAWRRPASADARLTSRCKKGCRVGRAVAQTRTKHIFSTACAAVVIRRRRYKMKHRPRVLHRCIVICKLRPAKTTRTVAAASAVHSVLRLDLDPRDPRGPRWWSQSTRVGEAANPGPSNGDAVHRLAHDGVPPQRLRYVTKPEAATVSYPSPNRVGFRDFVAPGHVAAAKGGQRQDFELTLETFNSTGWRSLKKRLATSKSHVLMAQETWITQAMIPTASRWAKKRGWKSIFAPAASGSGGGVSAGVAIFAKDFLGLHPPHAGGHIWHPSRVVAAVLEALGFRPFVVTSCYLHHGRGPDAQNLGILADIGKGVRGLGEDWQIVIGGDLNMTPEALAETDYDREIEASIFHPPTSRGTFRSSATASLIDFFLVSDRMAAAVANVATIEAAGTKGHVPVALKFRPRVTALKALHIRKPPPIPLERIYGPLLPPPRWEKAQVAADAALAAARSASGDAEQLLEDAYKLWADTAELELETHAGCNLKKRGLRGALPSLVWRSIMPERPLPSGYPRESAMQWLRGIAMELQRIGAIATMHIARARNGDLDDHGDYAADDDREGDDLLDGGTGDADEMGEDELDLTDDDTDAARRRPTRVADCRNILREIVASLREDLPEGDVLAAVIEEHSRTLDVAIHAWNVLNARRAGIQGSGTADGAAAQDLATSPPRRW